MSAKAHTHLQALDDTLCSGPPVAVEQIELEAPLGALVKVLYFGRQHTNGSTTNARLTAKVK